MKTKLNINYLLWGLTILALVLGVSQGRLWAKRAEVEIEIAELKTQAEQISGSNAELEKSLEYLQTVSAKEKLARGPLNLKKEGEIVINFSEPTKEELAGNPGETVVSNPTLWWEYFFNHNNKVN